MAKTTDIFELLTIDHQEARTLIQQLQDKARQGAIDEKKVDKLCRAMRFHMQFEEQHVYPEAKQVEQVGSMVPEAIEEHQILKDTLTDLENCTDAQEARGILDKALAALRHHVQEEETEMFPRLEKAWERTLVDKLGKQFSEQQEKALAQ